MGGDGGSIPGRADLVIEKQRKRHPNREEALVARWRHCQLSQHALRPPLAVCRLGRLYNKEAVLELLLDRARVDPSGAAAHIRSLRDVRAVSHVDCAPESYVCPVIGLAMNGRHAFELLWTCGCLLSTRALRMVTTDACPACETAFQPKEDRTLLYPTPAEEELRRDWLAQLEARVAAERAEKRANRKRAAEVPVKVDADEKAVTSAAAAASGACADKKSKRSSDKSHAAVVKVSIQADPKSTEVFKKLFTSCEDFKNRPKENFVTEGSRRLI